MDRLHALKVGAQQYLAHDDALGNVIALTDTAKAIQRTYAYTDWGVLKASSVDALPFNGKDRARWKGALWLGPETELYFMRNRWMEPRTGRFLFRVVHPG